jgi:hypothetical protein
MEPAPIGSGKKDTGGDPMVDITDAAKDRNTTMIDVLRSIITTPKRSSPAMAKMDPKLIAKSQQYEVTYFARKHRLTAADARAILQRAGRSREKANELAEASKKRR